MPLRDLFYVADLLQVHVKDKSLYSSKVIEIPAPHFVVFYNGMEDIPEREELKLSDAFGVKTDNPELELKVQILNINPGMNEELKEKCPVLREYIIYVDKIRKYTKIMPLAEAVERAIEECIDDNVLREFLVRQRAEVVKMSIYEYDEERELKLIRADEREIGKELGREEERKKTEAERLEKESALKKVEEERENAIKVTISLYRKFGQVKEEAVEAVCDKCGLSREVAQEKVRLYWE